MNLEYADCAKKQIEDDIKKATNFLNTLKTIHTHDLNTDVFPLDNSHDEITIDNIVNEEKTMSEFKSIREDLPFDHEQYKTGCIAAYPSDSAQAVIETMENYVNKKSDYKLPATIGLERLKDWEGHVIGEMEYGVANHLPCETIIENSIGSNWNPSNSKTHLQHIGGNMGFNVDELCLLGGLMPADTLGKSNLMTDHSLRLRNDQYGNYKELPRMVEQKRKGFTSKPYGALGGLSDWLCKIGVSSMIEPVYGYPTDWFYQETGHRLYSDVLRIDWNLWRGYESKRWGYSDFKKSKLHTAIVNLMR